MKKFASIALVMMILGSALVGCYSKTCDQQPMSSSYKK
jgi:hypothetical protein